MAADEASYVAKIAGGSLIAFQIGNEPDLYYRNGLRKADYTYADYQQEFNAYLSAIRGVLPNIPIAGPATASNFTWFSNFLSDETKNLIMATTHHYPLNAYPNIAKSDPKYASIQNLLSTVTTNGTANLIKKFEKAAQTNNVPLRFDETNSSYPAKGGLGDTFAASLWGADYLFNLAENGVVGANFFGTFLCNSYSPICLNNGFLGFFRQYQAQPLYYAMLLFHSAAQGRIVPVDITTASNVTVHAALGDDGKLHLTIINKDPMIGINAQIGTGSSYAQATAVRLTAKSLSSQGGVTFAGSSVNSDGTWFPSVEEQVNQNRTGYTIFVPAECSCGYLRELISVRVITKCLVQFRISIYIGPRILSVFIHSIFLLIWPVRKFRTVEYNLSLISNQYLKIHTLFKSNKVKRKISLYQSSALLIIILGTAVFSVWQVARSPSVLPDNSDPSSFSAQRAKQHVLAIAQQPHPNGSDEANKVEGYILQELSSFGINAEVQTENITSTGSNIIILQNKTQTENTSVNSSTIECKNIVAMIEGTDNQDAVLLSAHYDSKENSPGASDDGIGVATLLETARALKAGPALKNTIILLFTNPEETGLQGARAFVSDDALAKEVRVTWNVDAGGLKGPAFLITTSENNSWFIGELSKATHGIIADGSIQTFETSSSDFDIFNKSGYIAAAYGMTQDNRNHSPQDNILNFQDESLQQIGNTTLQFVRYFGNIQLPDVTLQPVGNSNILSVPYNGGIQLPVVSKNQNAGSADATYFTIPQLFMFSYPVVAALPISIVIVLIFGFAIWFGFKNKLIK